MQSGYLSAHSLTTFTTTTDFNSRGIKATVEEETVMAPSKMMPIVRMHTLVTTILQTDFYASPASQSKGRTDGPGHLGDFRVQGTRV